MKSCDLKHYAPIKTALKEVGFKVDSIVKQGKKTVITVTRYVNGEEKLLFIKEKQVGGK